MAKMYKYKVKLKRSFGFKCFKLFLKIFKSKPKIENLSGGELCPKAIYLSNHAGANGPLTYELYFPILPTGWGAHPMFGNVKERWNYLYHVFYVQKLHWNKFKAFTVATLFAPISKRLYRAIGLIPTYTDARFITTIKTSCKILDENYPILIFPEDSSKGYLNPPQKFIHGFITLSKLYYKSKGVDLPVYSMYLFPGRGKKRKIVIGKPIYINALLKEGKTEDEICQMALESMQNIYNNEQGDATVNG